MTLALLEVQLHKDRFGFKSPFVEFEGHRLWYQSGYKRTVAFAGDGTRLKGVVYPYYGRVHFPGARFHLREISTY